MSIGPWTRGLAVGIASLALAACAAEDEEPTADATEDALQSAPLSSRDMVRIAQPAGMPKPYEQPDSTGLFDERGKCGPTAVANMMRLYWVDLTPQQADARGVHWVIGTMGRQIESYLQREQPELGCTLEHPTNGAAFLRSKLKTGNPVLVWFNTENLGSHWVTAVGVRGTGAAESVVVMSWGRYYAIGMAKLTEAWRNVYGITNPAVVCESSTVLMSR
jgi:hypothetical protein